MRFKAVIFDLDDTLYDEFDFVKSGYKAVADYLSVKYNYAYSIILDNMLERYRTNGRDNLFDYILKKYNIQNNGIIKKLLGIYRSHTPSIRLYEDAVSVLKKLKAMKIKTGLITDGIKIAQQTKVMSLGLDEIMDHIVFTDDLGPKNGKLLVLPFELMCGVLEVEYIDSCYIGDNPSKDFLGPNKLNMTSIRLKRGMYKDVTPNDINYNPKYSISSLDEFFLI